MAETQFDRRFFQSTRGQVVRQLCEGPQTVSELAGHLEISENAVRSHLATLEGDGLVHLSGKRPGTRKPHFSYDLTAQARAHFKKGYEPVLLQLVALLAERLGDQELRSLLDDVGHALVKEYLPRLPQQTPAARLKAIVTKLTKAGLPIDATREQKDVIVTSCSCPLDSLVRLNPGFCNLVADFLANLLECQVEQSCDHGAASRCKLRIAGNGAVRTHR